MANTNTMTKREFLQKVVNQQVGPEEVEFAVQEIAKMDEANEKRKAKLAEKQAAKAEENAPIMEAIETVLSDGPAVAKAITEYVNSSIDGADYSVQKICSVIRLNMEGVVEKGEKKEKGASVYQLV